MKSPDLKTGWLGEEIQAAVNDVSQWPSGLRRESELSDQLTEHQTKTEIKHNRQELSPPKSD